MVSSTSFGLSSTRRISTSSSGVILFALSSFWKREVEGSSFVHFSFSPNAASVPKDDALNERQADACALEIFNIVEALKDTKQFTAVLHVESDSIVANVIGVLIAVFAETDLDCSVMFWPSEFERIRDQVIKDLTD